MSKLGISAHRKVIEGISWKTKFLVKRDVSGRYIFERKTRVQPNAHQRAACMRLHLLTLHIQERAVDMDTTDPTFHTS